MRTEHKTNNVLTVIAAERVHGPAGLSDKQGLVFGQILRIGVDSEVAVRCSDVGWRLLPGTT